jgi:hypothetical protein
MTNSDRYDERPQRLSDAPAFLRAATQRARLKPGANLLVATDLEQNVLGVKTLPPRRAAYERRSRLAYDLLAPALERMLPKREWGKGPTGIGYLIRGREGRAVPALDDLEWAYTLLWACGSICCFSGDVVVVTPYGWRFHNTAGWSPTLADLAGPRLRAVAPPLEAS